MKRKMYSRIAGATLVLSHICSAQMVIPAGTRISARLEQTLSSATAEQGMPVQLSVVDAVKVNGTVVIPQGAPVVGTVVIAQQKRSMGRTGKLDFSVDKVRAADGEYVPLRYTMQKREGGSKGTSTGIMTAGAAVLFWPATPFILMRKGKDVTLNKGMAFEVFTDADHALTGTAQVISQATVPQSPQNLVPSGPQLMTVAQSAQPAQATAAELSGVNITSDVPGAEIEVDGVFVGSTPGTAKVAPGLHKITVRHGANVWSRDLMVQPQSNVNVNAILKK